MPKIKIYVETGYVGASHKDSYDFPDDEWEALSEEEKEETLNNIAQDFMQNCIDYGAYVEE